MPVDSECINFDLAILLTALLDLVVICNNVSYGEDESSVEIILELRDNVVHLCGLTNITWQKEGARGINGIAV